MPSKTPKPGQPVRSSTTGRPIMAALDLLGHRWALRAWWRSVRPGPSVPDRSSLDVTVFSPSVLYDRLRELTEAGLICREGQDYTLTALGRSLRDAIAPLIRRVVEAVGEASRLTPGGSSRCSFRIAPEFPNTRHDGSNTGWEIDRATSGNGRQGANERPQCSPLLRAKSGRDGG